MSMRLLCAFFCTLAVLTVYSEVAHAQLYPDGLVRQLELSLTPRNPGANATVRVSIRSFAIDLDRSEVVWYVNGEEVARGSGLNEIRVTTGDSGSVTDVQVIAEDQDGVIAQASALLRPVEVELLWESLAYTPPFYKGRALPGSHSTIRLQAIAHLKRENGTNIPNSDIIYSWYRNGAYVAEISGRGKFAAVVRGPSLFSTDVYSVIVESLDRTLRGEAQATLLSQDPHVELYVKHPLFGILFNRALSTNVVDAQGEETVAAVPFFANVLSPASNSLVYDWKVNNMVIPPNPETPNILTITAQGYEGLANIKLLLTNARDLLMEADGSWQINFSGGGGGFFRSSNEQNPFMGNQ